MKAIRYLAILFCLTSAAGAQPPRAQVSRAPSRDLMVITKVEVLTAVGPDKEAWASSWRDSSPQTLTFRWSNEYPNVGSAVWQVSTDAEANNLIASGDAGKPPKNGSMGSFAIDFRPLVGGSQQRPLDYYVRVVTYKGEPLMAQAQPDRTLSRQSADPSTPVAREAAPRRVTPKELAGPASQPVLVSIIGSGEGTQFTEIGLRPELLHTMEVEIDLETLKIEGEGSDEDPYLFVVAVWADGTTVVPEFEAGNLVFPTATVRIDSPSKTHENIPGGDAGDTIPIPRSTGHFERTIHPIGVEQLANRFGKSLTAAQKRQVRQNTLVGLVVIGMEEDALPTTETVNESRNELVRELDAAFSNILHGVEVPVFEQEEIEMPDLVAAVRETTGEIRERLVESAKARTLDELASYLVIPGFPTLILVPGIANQDDYIGHDTAVFNYDEILEAGTTGLPIDLELSQNYVNVPRYLQEGRTETIRYRIKGRIRRR